MSNFFYKLKRILSHVVDSFRWKLISIEISQIFTNLGVSIALWCLAFSIIYGAEGAILGAPFAMLAFMAQLLLSVLYDTNRKAKRFFDKYYGKWCSVKSYFRMLLRSEVWRNGTGGIIVVWNIIGAVPVYYTSQLISSPVTLDAGMCQIVNSVALIFSITLYPLLRKGAIWLYQRVIAPVLLKTFWFLRIKVPFMKGRLLSSEYYTIRADQDTENFLGRLGMYDKEYPQMWDTRERD